MIKVGDRVRHIDRRIDYNTGVMIVVNVFRTSVTCKIVNDTMHYLYNVEELKLAE